jgi:hypothetical protein
MSSSRNTTASTNNGNNGPYCKVCHDAGRSRSEYTSHFVKDQPGPNGKVVCPTLLNQHCRICNKPGHTSSYCSQYRSYRDREQPRREEPRREERYIEREPRREERYIEREPRREERYIEREQPRREERYIEREQPRRDSYDRLREDTERRERESRERDDAYYREQERRSKPWLQAALKPAESRQPQQRREPYAHPHGPRVRLSLEAPALSAAKHADPVIDVRRVELNHASNWGDEDANQPFVCDPEQMTRKFLEECLMSNLTTSQEHDFIAECDDQSEMPFMCGQ